MKRQPIFNVRFFNQDRNELTREEVLTETVVADELAKFHATWVVNELGKIDDEDLRLDIYTALTSDRACSV